MQTYKIKKITETSMYPIEYELKLLRRENEKNWLSLMDKFISVVFSGIAVTLLCQDDYIPKLANYLACKFNIGNTRKYIFEIISIVVLFAVLTFVLCMIFWIKNKLKDNKKTEADRYYIAEYFHKVIFNNITTGRSFLKKSKELILTEEERELYRCEAVYYFNVACMDIHKYKIFEVGNREKQKLFLDLVGINTLRHTLNVYLNSINELERIIPSPEKDVVSNIHKSIIGWNQIFKSYTT